MFVPFCVVCIFQPLFCLFLPSSMLTAVLSDARSPFLLERQTEVGASAGKALGEQSRAGLIIRMV